MEPCDHGMEHEADVRPGRGEVSQIMPLFASICCVCEKRSVVGATTEVSSANATIRTRIRGCDAGPQNLPPPNIPNPTPEGRLPAPPIHCSPSHTDLRSHPAVSSRIGA